MQFGIEICRQMTVKSRLVETIEDKTMKRNIGLVLLAISAVGVSVFLLNNGVEQAQKDSPVELLSADPATKINNTSSESGVQQKHTDAAVDSKVPEQSERTDSGSFRDEILELSHYDRQFVANLNARYFGSFEYDNERQADWLEASGFPSSEVIITVNGMTDEELAIAAQTLGQPYVALQADRKMEQYAQQYPLSRSTTDSPTDAQKYAQFEIYQSVQQLMKEPNPFGAYVAARYHSDISRDPIKTLVSLNIAYHTGDSRAVNAINQLVQRERIDRSVFEALAQYAAAMSNTDQHSANRFPGG